MMATRSRARGMRHNPSLDEEANRGPPVAASTAESACGAKGGEEMGKGKNMKKEKKKPKQKK